MGTTTPAEQAVIGSAAPAVPPTPLRVRFSARYLGMVAPLRATKDIRYYLNGVYVCGAPGGGVYIVATNGSTMGMVLDRDGEITGVTPTEGVLLRCPPALVTAARATQRSAKTSAYQVLLADGRLSVAAGFGFAGTDSETYVCPGRPTIEGKFPPFRRVLPNFDKLKRAPADSVNARLLGVLSDVLPPTYGKVCAAVNLWQEFANGVIAAQFPDVPELLVLIMPMRDPSSKTDDMVRQALTATFGRREATVATVATAPTPS